MIGFHFLEFALRRGPLAHRLPDVQDLSRDGHVPFSAVTDDQPLSHRVGSCGLSLCSGSSAIESRVGSRFSAARMILTECASSTGAKNMVCANSILASWVTRLSVARGSDSRRSVQLGRTFLFILAMFYVDFAFSDSALPPASTVFVRVRASATDFVVKRLRAVAVDNGLTCNLDDRRVPPALLCQFDGVLWNAIITSTDESEGLVRIDVFYWDDSLNIDKKLEAKMQVLLRQFANSLKRNRRVEAIRRCNIPVKLNFTKDVCDGQSIE